MGFIGMRAPMSAGPTPMKPLTKGFTKCTRPVLIFFFCPVASNAYHKKKQKQRGGVVSKNGSRAPFFELTPKTMLVNMPSNYTKKNGSTSLGTCVGASSWGGRGGGPQNTT
jgi:hypothetical protein